MDHFTLPSILHHFGYSEDLLLRKDNSFSMNYVGANLYYPDTDLFRHCLYIVEGNQIPTPLLQGNYGCVLVRTEDYPFAGDCAAETVIWPEKTTAVTLLNRILNLHLSQSSQSHLAHMLMSSLSLNASIGSIIHQAATIMQNPIMLLDPAYQLIAMDGLGCEIDDIFWKDCLEQHRVSDEHIAMIRNTGLTKKLEETNQVAFWEDEDYFNGFPRLAKKIYSPNHIYLGTIAVVQCKHEFAPDDFFLLDALVETLGTILSHYSFLTEQQQLDSDLLTSMWKKESRDVFSSAWKTRMEEIQQYKFYLAGYIPLSTDPALSRLGGYIQTAILSGKNELLSAVDNGNVLFLCCFDEIKAVNPTRKAMKEKTEPLNIQVGLSPIFTDLSQFPEKILLAEEAVTLGMTHDHTRQRHIYPYQGVSYLQLLDSLPRATLEQFIRNSPIAPICTEKYSEYYKTLKCFVGHLGSYAETAQDLFIHKNTLLYRLSKIQALTGIDYSSADDLYDVAYTFVIHEYLNNQITVTKEH